MTTLSVTPAEGLLDEPRRIAVEGLQPAQTVVLSTRTLRGNGQYWLSSATYVADAEGRVDLERYAPVSGSYEGVSALGLLWSQRPEVEGAADVFPDDVLQPLVTRIFVEGSDQEVALIQRLAAHGVTRREVREDGLVGTLFMPASKGPHPAVVVLNGSGGGINEHRAALYASRGYAAFALGYFKAPGLSPYISNTPLEYFVAGLNWVRREVRPAHDFVALSGQSRGGELVLLLGSMFPEAVSAVIGYVPSALVHGGQAAADPAVGRDGPAWLYEGKPLVHLWNDNKTASWAAKDAGLRNAESISTALLDHETVKRVTIPVEKIQGPVLLLSAGDDAAWPSARFSRMALQRLQEAGHPWPVQHLDFEHAGHTILLPHIPATYSVDGTPAANAEANEQSWRAVKAFLDEAVNARAAKES